VVPQAPHDGNQPPQVQPVRRLPRLLPAGVADEHGSPCVQASNRCARRACMQWQLSRLYEPASLYEWLQLRF